MEKINKWFPESKREKMAYNLFYWATFMLVTKYITEGTWLTVTLFAFGAYLTARTVGDKISPPPAPGGLDGKLQ